jgi:hypothetical protein
MKNPQSITVLKQYSNHSVIQLPWRKNPGVVIQGDSLNCIFDSICEIEKMGLENDIEGINDEIIFLKARVKVILEDFERALNSND